MSDRFVISSSPHFLTRGNTAGIMWLVVVALLPTAVAGVIIFGLPAAFVIGVSVATCVATEVLSQLAFKRPVTIKDGSAVVTGLLLAFILPSSTPFWVVIVGGVSAIFLVKQLFGGLGFNIFNPALAARAVLQTSFPVFVNATTRPVHSILSFDAVTAASALNAIKEGTANVHYSLGDLFFGTVPGALGETCKLTLLIGAALLVLFRVVDLRIPLPYIAVAALLSWIFGRDPLEAVLSGGLILGAFFMATDLVTSPATPWGKVVFGAGCGILTIVIRNYGGFPEGVCYSILLMNCAVPLLDKAFRPRVFGTRTSALRKTAAAPKGGSEA
ncbi:MAG: RnfABCDGE type electron transport complex subunit D [Spirochaetales bacterium]|nr:RnfABCDGE type electron transport complex subunit D [Spirochaetales bacterium]